MQPLFVYRLAEITRKPRPARLERFPRFKERCPRSRIRRREMFNEKFIRHLERRPYLFDDAHHKRIVSRVRTSGVSSIDALTLFQPDHHTRSKLHRVVVSVVCTVRLGRKGRLRQLTALRLHKDRKKPAYQRRLKLRRRVLAEHLQALKHRSQHRHAPPLVGTGTRRKMYHVGTPALPAVSRHSHPLVLETDPARMVLVEVVRHRLAVLTDRDPPGRLLVVLK